jgi:hypothetical protein
MTPNRIISLMKDWARADNGFRGPENISTLPIAGL